MFHSNYSVKYFSSYNNSESDLKIIASDCFKVEYTNECRKTGETYNEICYVFRKEDAYRLIYNWDIQLPENYHYKIVSITKE